MHTDQNTYTYVRVRTPSAMTRFVPVSKVIQHKAKKTSRAQIDVEFEFLENPHLILEWCPEMKWLDAFPCYCNGGIQLDWENEWQNSYKELI